MTQWKLGTGAYSSLVGYTWPTNEPPSVQDVMTGHYNTLVQVNYQDISNYNAFGIGSQKIPISGMLSSSSERDNLRAVARRSNINTSGDVVSEPLRLYMGVNDKFYYVLNATYSQPETTEDMGWYPYRITFDCYDPFSYEDAVTDYDNGVTIGDPVNSVGTSGTMINGGNAYCFPYFEITNSNATPVTALTITDYTGDAVGNVLTISSCSIAQGKYITVYQGLGDGKVWGSVVGDDDGANLASDAGTLSGTKIVWAGSATARKIRVTFTAGGGASGSTGTFYVHCRERHW